MTRALDPVTRYRREKAKSVKRHAKAYDRLMQLAASDFRRQTAWRRKGRRHVVEGRPCVRCAGPVADFPGRRLTVCDVCASPREQHERALVRARVA